MPSKRVPDVIIAAARGHIARIRVWVRDMSAATFSEDERTRFACERAFIALGEALSDLSTKVDLPVLVPNGPWVDPIRFRHFLAHDYDDRTIPPLVWDTIQFDLPELEAALDQLEVALRAAQ